MANFTLPRLSALRSSARQLPARVMQDSLLRNSLYIMATTVISSLLGYGYWVIAARSYDASEVGLVSALVSVMTLTSLLSNLGCNSALVQWLPKNRSTQDWSLTLNTALIVTTLTSLLGGLVAVVIFLSTPQYNMVSHDPTYLLAFLASVPLTTAATLIDAVFTAERANNNMLIRNAIFAVLKIALLAAFIPMHIGALGIFLSWIVAIAVSLGASAGLIRRLGHGYVLALRGVVGKARTMFASLVGHHFTNLGGAAPMYLLPAIVIARLSAADNAYFYATWMLGSQFSLISVAVAAALFAEGSYTSDDLFRQMRSSILITAGLLLPLMATFIVVGPTVLSVFGSAYSEHGSQLLLLLTLAAIPDAITSIYISVLRVQRRLRSCAALNLSMALITIGLAWLLLPSMGIAGAGVAWLTAQSVGTTVSIIDFLVTRRHLMIPVEAQFAAE